MASDILSYNVVQDHEGISIKGYRGLRPQGDLIYSDLSVLTLSYTLPNNKYTLLVAPSLAWPARPCDRHVSAHASSAEAPE